MDSQVAVQRRADTPGSAGSSFDRDLGDIIWTRARLVFLIGIVMSLIANTLHGLVLRSVPEVESIFAPLHTPIWLGHPLGFLVGLALLYAWRGAEVTRLQTLVFAVFAYEIILSQFAIAYFIPDDPLFIAVAVMVFVPAALIPWPVRYQIGLGAAALGAFLSAKGVTAATVPGLAEFWASRGGTMGQMNHVIEGAVGVATLAVIAVIASRTLYTLRKAAHKAKRLGNYLIHEELGEGGMGRVYLAQHALLCRPTAVKVLRPDIQHPTALARFDREVRLSSTLTHPNTITIYDFGRTQANEFYYAMEYLEGLDLQDLVERFGPQPASRVAVILAHAASSLAEAHSRDIVHRDIKPSNIFLTRRGGLYDFIKVLDFGLAKEIESDDADIALTQSGAIFGTPLYIAPETVYGNDNIDGRADIYNLGGVAYWLLTGQPPFSSERSMEVLIDHVKTVPPRPSKLSELEIPPELNDIVMKCLEKKPADRFQSAEELESALRAIPFDPPWTQKSARDWWTLHGIIGEDARDCECFPPDGLRSDIAALPEIAVGQSA